MPTELAVAIELMPFLSRYLCLHNDKARLVDMAAVLQP